VGTPSVRRLRLEHDDLGFLEEAARLLGFQVQKFLGLLKLHSPMQFIAISARRWATCSW
jgi:hypothetical protein